MTQLINLADLTLLPIAERLDLIEELWDSLDADALPLSDWQRDEIDKRLRGLEHGSSKGATWENARARITGQP
jgi:putative addiction module component (TIGR02574 family)